MEEKATVNIKTGRFDQIDSVIIISSVSNAVHNCKQDTADDDS